MLYLLTKGRTGGCTIAQAVSHWLPTAVAHVRAWVWSHEICGGQSGAGAGLFRVLWFPLPIFIPPTAPQSPSFIIWHWNNRPVVAAVPSGLTSHPTINKEKKGKTANTYYNSYNTDHLNNNFFSGI
jgi:hypothetical protein